MLSGESWTPGNNTSTETFVATSGTLSANFTGGKLESKAIELTSTDGTTWTLGSDNKIKSANGLDELTVSYTNGSVIASVNHGETQSDVATFAAEIKAEVTETATTVTTGYVVGKVDAEDGTDTLKINLSGVGVTGADSEVTLTVTYDADSTTKSAKIGDTVLTLGTASSFSVGTGDSAKTFSITLSSDAIKNDGDLTEDDITAFTGTSETALEATPTSQLTFDLDTTNDVTTDTVTIKLTTSNAVDTITFGTSTITFNTGDNTFAVEGNNYTLSTGTDGAFSLSLASSAEVALGSNSILTSFGTSTFDGIAYYHVTFGSDNAELPATTTTVTNLFGTFSGQLGTVDNYQVSLSTATDADGNAIGSVANFGTAGRTSLGMTY